MTQASMQSPSEIEIEELVQAFREDLCNLAEKIARDANQEQLLKIHVRGSCYRLIDLGSLEKEFHNHMFSHLADKLIN